MHSQHLSRHRGDHATSNVTYRKEGKWWCLFTYFFYNLTHTDNFNTALPHCMPTCEYGIEFLNALLVSWTNWVSIGAEVLLTGNSMSRLIPSICCSTARFTLSIIHLFRAAGSNIVTLLKLPVRNKETDRKNKLMSCLVKHCCVTESHQSHKSIKPLLRR